MEQKYTRDVGGEDYYTDSRRKVADFFIGFVGIWILASIIFFLFYFYGIIFRFGSDFGYSMLFLGPIIFFIVAIVLVAIGYRIRRRYISIGIISSAIIPLLLYGACWVVLVGAFR